jgi:hypothetical protein
MHQAFLDCRAAYPGVVEGRMHCKLCGYSGHRRDACPVVAALHMRTAAQTCSA